MTIAQRIRQIKDVEELAPIALEVQALEEQVGKIPALQATAKLVAETDLRLKETEGQVSALQATLHSRTQEAERTGNILKNEIMALATEVNRLELQVREYLNG